MSVQTINAAGSIADSLREVARQIFETLRAQATDAPLTVGLCGGRSVVGLLSALEQESQAQPGDLLQRVHFFMVDERLVSLTDEQSNYGGLKKLLFDQLVTQGTIRSQQLHPFAPDTTLPDWGCSAYGEELKRYGGRFTVVVLGVGEDGHIAGLFPNHQVLREDTKGFFTFLDSPKPPPARMTAGKQLIVDSDLSVVLILGEGKRSAWETFRVGKASISDCPALIATHAKRCIVVTDLV